MSHTAAITPHVTAAPSMMRAFFRRYSFSVTVPSKGAACEVGIFTLFAVRCSLVSIIPALVSLWCEYIIQDEAKNNGAHFAIPFPTLLWVS